MSNRWPGPLGNENRTSYVPYAGPEDGSVADWKVWLDGGVLGPAYLSPVNDDLILCGNAKHLFLYHKDGTLYRMWSPAIGTVGNYQFDPWTGSIVAYIQYYPEPTYFPGYEATHYDPATGITWPHVSYSGFGGYMAFFNEKMEFVSQLWPRFILEADFENDYNHAGWCKCYWGCCGNYTIYAPGKFITTGSSTFFMWSGFETTILLGDIGSSEGYPFSGQNSQFGWRNPGVLTPSGFFFEYDYSWNWGDARIYYLIDGQLKQIGGAPYLMEGEEAAYPATLLPNGKLAWLGGGWFESRQHNTLMRLLDPSLIPLGDASCELPNDFGSVDVTRLLGVSPQHIVSFQNPSGNIQRTVLDMDGHLIQRIATDNKRAPTIWSMDEGERAYGVDTQFFGIDEKGKLMFVSDEELPSDGIFKPRGQAANAQMTQPALAEDGAAYTTTSQWLVKFPGSRGSNAIWYGE